ncbi:MAG: primosomal protein N' [Thiobacillus sp.]
MPIIRVALDLPLSTLFDYVLAEGVAVVPGQRVIVPFGRKQVVGVVMECAADSELAAERIKPVQRVLDEIPPLPAELLTLLRFCSDYYHHPLGATVLSALPVRLRSCEPVTFKEALHYTLSVSGRTLDLHQLDKRKVVQYRILTALREGALSAAQLRALSPSAATALKALVQAGWVETCASVAAPTAFTFNNAHTLTVAQQQAVDVVTQAQGYGCFLLHGVTGSGKTELYLRLIDAVLAKEKQALVLIPEIALTPQLEQHFRRRFPGRRFATLHSGLAEKDRAENWLAAPDCDVLLGTRLSVFAPLPRLGLIVVDEEHDASFKQQDSLRYSARDVAIARGKQCGVPVVLGSATPSLESYAQVTTGRYRLIELQQRAIRQARLPAIELVDLKHIPLDNGLTRPALLALTETLARGEQSLVFLNRRGYAPALYCPSCAWVSPCPRCSARLVLHRTSHRLKCHHCGFETRIPPACPSCGNPDLKALGQGTQRLEETLAALLPTARIRRIDRDTMRPRAWAELGAAVHGGEVDILVGTQMLAKGHDFPNMTLALILDTDGALYSPDFRATERLFAQLMQVAGRAGRADKPGRVLIQTAFPDHPLFRYLQRHDFAGYARALLAERRQLDLPPFTRQILLRAEAPTMEAALSFLQRAAALAPDTADVSVFSATPAPMARVANLERAQLLIQSASRLALQAFVRDWRPLLDTIKPRVARWSLDVDPLVF